MALKTKEKPGQLEKAEPAHALTSFERWEQQFEDMFRRPFSLLNQPWLPSRFFERAAPAPTVDIFEEGGDIVVKAELPGMNKEDVSVDLHDHMLTISGEKKKEEKVEEKNFYRLERTYGSFTRSFEIPSDVKNDEVKAKFHEGVLEVRMPKTEEARKKAQKVPIE